MSCVTEMALVRIRTSLSYIFVILFLATVNVITLYIFSTGMYQAQLKSTCPTNPPCEDCHHYQNLIKIQDDLLKKLHLNYSRSNLNNALRTSSHRNSKPLPTIFVVTPTYTRLTQKADLIRLCFALMHVPKLHWIIVEDSDVKTELVQRLLSGEHSCKIPLITHLNVRTAENLRLGTRDKFWYKCRGAEQRNYGIDWLIESASKGVLGDLYNADEVESVVYFADDDNTYDIQVFNEMRYTKWVSMWPVGLSGGLKFEGPTCSKGKVTGWYAVWDKTRKFQVDMAGFAINLDLLLSKPLARFDPYAKQGHLESSLLQHVTTMNELEAKANDCNKVLVWHTRTEKSKLKHEEQLKKKGRPSNPLIEV